jgi:hypothetical protein
MALLHARGEMQIGATFTAHSIVNSEFHGRFSETTAVGDIPAIIPEITGRGWITGPHQHMLDPDDPWPEGYRLSATWPDLKRQRKGRSRNFGPVAEVDRMTKETIRNGETKEPLA